MTRASARKARMLRKYGVSEDNFIRMFDQCQGRCPGCRKPFNDSDRPPCIEHNHRTGLVRGLLCFYCNGEVGTHHDNAGWFFNIGHYLTDPPAASLRIYVPGSPGAEGALT